MNRKKPPAKKATPPVYNTLNDICGAWSLTLAYDDAGDILRLTAHTPGGRWARSQRLNKTYPVDEVEEALGDALVLVRTWGAARLF